MLHSRLQQSDAAASARNALSTGISGGDSLPKHQYHIQLFDLAELSANRVRLLDAVFANRNWRSGAHISAHDGILVGAKGALANRLLEHVGCLLLPHRAGRHLLHYVAQRQAVSRVG